MLRREPELRCRQLETTIIACVIRSSYHSENSNRSFPLTVCACQDIIFIEENLYEMQDEVLNFVCTARALLLLVLCFKKSSTLQGELSEFTCTCESLIRTVVGDSYGKHIIMTKTFTKLYERIYSIENLHLAFRKARKGKAGKMYVIEFEANLNDELIALKNELENETYQPRQLHRFTIRDPKTRVIHAPAFRDRVAHHAICNILEPIFERTFIHDSYASRKGKGTHAALMRFDEFKRQVSRNGKLVPDAKDNNIREKQSISGSRRCYASSQMVCGFALKADIKHYFPSINHEILSKLLARKIIDKKILKLLNTIIKSYGTTSDSGMPLGALTSQLFANVYLNPLDHFVKETLRAKFYLRYLDDFVILHSSREQLEIWKRKIETFLHSELKLELHAEKTKIFPMHRGVNLLGFRCFYYYRLLKKNSIQTNANESQFADNKDEHLKSLAGWLAHAKWANTYKLRCRTLQNAF